MWTYRPPMPDMRFVIEEVLRASASWAEVPAFAGLDINAAADLQACRWHDGVVTTAGG